MEYKYPSNRLTVIIRDDGPLYYVGDSPTCRTVNIELTVEQVKKLALKEVWRDDKGDRVYEKISQCFIEPREIV